ncbi:MAG: PAS domain-containing protein [Campylobacterota bacterium]|nr:PAS domain-containing protein [Campylobacterota bacterium]
MGLRPLDIEVKVDSKKELLSETDTQGVITYANENFVELSGYSEAELVGSPHNILRHIDMPKTVYKLLWDNLKTGKPYKAIVQNKRKDGKYYWVYSEYEPLFDKTKNLRGFRSKRFPVPKKALEEVETIYKKLLHLEETKSQKEAEQFLELKLHNDGYHDYAEFVEAIFNKKLKGLLGFFGKLFG